MIELFERPLSRNHRPVSLSLLLLSDPEVDERALVRRPAKLHVLPVAVALVDAIDENVHCDTRCNEVC